MAPLKTYGSKKRKLLISKDKINAKKSIKNARRPLATLQSENIVIPELVKCKTTQKTVSVENKDVTNTSPSFPGSELSSIWNCDSTFDKLLQPTTKPKPAHKDVVDNVRSLGSEVTKTNPNKLTETPTINTLPSRSKYYKLRLLNKENSGKSSDSSSHACLACSNPSISSTCRSKNSRQITSTPNVNGSSDNAKFLEFTPIYPEAERTRCEKSPNLQVRHESLVGSPEVVCSPKMEPELPFVSSPDMFSNNEISSCVPQARKISVRQSLRQLRSSISSSNYLVPCDENINKCGDNVSQSTRDNSSISTNCGERVNNEHQEEESANSLGNNISSKTQLSPIASESDNNSDEAMDDVVSSPIIYDTRLRNRKVRWNDHSSLKNHSGSMSKKSVCEDSQDISAEVHLVSAPVSKTASEIVPPVMVRPSAAFNRRTSIWQSSRVRAASRRFSVVPGKLLAKPRQDSLGFRGFHGILAPEAQELENFYTKLGETFGNISITSTDESKNIPANVSINITARDVVLQKCGQEDPLPFSDIFPEEYLSKCRKIGEGLYGEVFMWESGGNSSVLKIIPIDGDELINGERQKTFDEILSEIVITKELSDLRYESHDGSGGDLTSGFVEVKRTACVMGKYPPRLLQLWEDFAEESGTENDNPEVFSETQLFIVLELANGGADLEKYVFNNASQALSVFLQTAYALAAAERRIEFEHRDLHWGNVLVSKTDVKQVNLVLNGTATKVATHGVQVSIIDFTLSRMTYDGCCIYNDLSQDDSLFVSEGDYQFDVYRLMKENCRNNWQEFVPANNILWLHYLVDKMLMGVHYRRTASKVHRDNLKKLRSIEKSLLDFTSTTDFIESQVQI